MRIEYNKLIRDRIPEIIDQDGKQFATEIMNENDYKQALLEKLVEEAGEARIAAPGKLITELADLLEVIDALLETSGIDRDQLRAIQSQRQFDRGGFEKRLKLLWVEQGESEG
jgi:predicted house-cleaning noncanonical NTP pyrophosphatase (MazG superfamily)